MKSESRVFINRKDTQLYESQEEGILDEGIDIKDNEDLNKII
jgi:hypothetical protein